MASTRSTTDSKSKVTKGRKGATTTKKSVTSKKQQRSTTPKKKKTTKTTTPKKVDVADQVEDVGAVSVEDLFESISAGLLRELLEGNSHKVPKSFPKKKCTKAILDDANEKGQKHLLDTLDKATMRSAAQDLEKTEDLGHDSKTKMMKTIKEHIETEGFEKFLKDLSLNVLNDMCKLLGFEEEGTKDEIENALKEEAMILGLKGMLEQMQKDYLNDVARDVKVKLTGTKEDLKNRILSKAFPHLEEEIKMTSSKKKKEKVQPVKVDIKKGVSREELHQQYAGDLIAYCSTEGLKKSGNKKDIITRILKYLDGDEETTKPMKPGETKKRRRLAKMKASQSKSSTKSAPAKKATGTKRKAGEKAENETNPKKSK